MKRLLLLFISIFTLCGFVWSSNSDFVVVIDPGHGGRDAGAVRGTYKEKTINLAIAKEVGRLIEANMSGVKVVYTRTTDKMVALKARPQIAIKAKANLFISIHTNSTEAKTTRAVGADTYILGVSKTAESLAVAKRENSVIKYEDDYSTSYEGFDPDSPESDIIFEFMVEQNLQQSLDIASYIQKEFKTSAKRVDRGVRQAHFWVLKQVGIPSVLIEVGFINNATEAKYLVSAAGQKKMALAIYNGFKKYKTEYDRKSGHIVASNVVTKTPEKEPIVEKTQVIEKKPVVVKRPLIEKKEPVTVKTNTTTKQKTNTIKTNVSNTNSRIEYKIQFLYSPTKLPTNSPRFKGLQGVTFYQDKGYKYTYGSSYTYKGISKTLKEVQLKFKDAFVIRMKDGKRL